MRPPVLLTEKLKINATRTNYQLPYTLSAIMATSTGTGAPRQTVQRAVTHHHSPRRANSVTTKRPRIKETPLIVPLQAALRTILRRSCITCASLATTRSPKKTEHLRSFQSWLSVTRSKLQMQKEPFLSRTCLSYLVRSRGYCFGQIP